MPLEVLEQVTANISGKVRRETLHGRKYLVAPLSLIVPGVLNGSKGPLLYTEEDTAAGADAWNGMPIVVNHPTDNGKPVSARKPTILEKFQIGTVFETTMNGKLSAEGWFDEELTRRVDSRVLSALTSNSPMELSTGLYTTDEAAQSGAVHNGKPYTAIARSHRPDHLAVLPDKVGACSLDDGCGLNVNEQNDTFFSKLNKMFEKFFSKSPNVQEPPEVKTMPKLTDNEKKTLVDSIILNCDCWKEEDRETLNGMEDRVLQGISTGVSTSKTLKEQEAVVNAAKKGFQVGNDTYTLNEKGEWIRRDPATPPPIPGKNPPTENKVTQMTSEDWFNSAPPEVQSAVRNAVNMERAEKDRLVQSLVSNIADDATRKQQAERLSKRSIEDLREDARLIGNNGGQNNNPFSPGYVPDYGVPNYGGGYPVPNYSGASVGGPTYNTDDIDRNDHLLPPVINYAEEAEARKQKSA